MGRGSVSVGWCIIWGESKTASIKHCIKQLYCSPKPVVSLDLLMALAPLYMDLEILEIQVAVFIELTSSFQLKYMTQVT